MCMHTNWKINLSDDFLMLNLAVDENSKRVEKLEEALARMEMLGMYIRYTTIEMRCNPTC